MSTTACSAAETLVVARTIVSVGESGSRRTRLGRVLFGIALPWRCLSLAWLLRRTTKRFNNKLFARLTREETIELHQLVADMRQEIGPWVFAQRNGILGIVTGPYFWQLRADLDRLEDIEETLALGACSELKDFVEHEIAELIEPKNRGRDFVLPGGS